MYKIVFDDKSYYQKTHLNKCVDELRCHKGVGFKCIFCVDRLKKGKKPACVQVCLTSCRIFSDLDDPNSEISTLIKSRSGFPLLPDKGTESSVFYTR